MSKEFEAGFAPCVGPGLVFLRTKALRPVGTLVRLKSDRLGVVTDNSKSLLRPMVRVFFSIRQMLYVQPETIDLNRPGVGEAIVCQRSQSACVSGRFCAAATTGKRAATNRRRRVMCMLGAPAGGGGCFI